MTQKTIEERRHESECREIEHRNAERRSIEMAVIGSMVLFEGQDAAEFAAGELSGSEFGFPDLRIQFKVVCEMLAAGIPCDAITLGDELGKRGQFEAGGGTIGIAEVLEAVPNSAHIRYYVQKLQAIHQRDELRLLSQRLERWADDTTREPSETIDVILSELEGLKAGNVRKSELITAGDALESFDRRSDDTAEVIPTGLLELDRLLFGGIRSGQLVVIGGRPGLGKSALKYQITMNAARNHRPGLFASLEMTSGEHAGRALQTISRQRFAELPVLFSEVAEFTKLTSLIRLAKRRHSIQLAAIDYLQLIESPTVKGELRERQIANMSRGLKRLAMELKIPILLGSQLNRESEKRGRPSLADLRESGAIEQDADIVILIAGDAETDDRELIIAKHRGGPVGMVNATFDRPRFTFSCEPFTGKL